MELAQHTVSSLANLEWKLGTSLVGKLTADLSISKNDYYKSKAKKAEKRREYNKTQIKGYHVSLSREIEAALYGVPDHDKFVVAVDTIFEAARTGYIKRFKTYSFELHPPAVSSNGKIVSRKKRKTIVLIGPTAREALQRMVDECATEFGLQTRYYADKNSLPPELQRLVDKETGIIIVDTFYPLITERKGTHQITFRSQKDMRKAIMRALEPEFDLITKSWRCSFSDLNKIQRSVSTLADWGVSRLQMTEELDKKLALARRRFRKALSKLQMEGLDQTKSRLESIQSKFNQITTEYSDAKSRWKNAEKFKGTRAKEYLQVQSDSIRRIEQCGQRLELEVLPELEEILKTDPKVGKLTKTKEALNRLAGIIDWGQRLSFILDVFASVAIPH